MALEHGEITEQIIGAAFEVYSILGTVSWRMRQKSAAIAVNSTVPPAKAKEDLDVLLKVDGFVAAQRFKIAPKPDDDGPKYLAIYEIETDDINATLGMVRHRAGTPDMPMSETITNMKTYLIEPLGARKQA